MPLVSEETLNAIDPNSFGPQNVAEQLAFLPEVFEFLKNRESLLGKTRPVVTYTMAANLWALRQCGHQQRELPAGLLDHLWERLAEGRDSSRLTEALEQLEPHLWSFSLRLMQGAMEREEWSHQDLAAASLVYSAVLFACLYVFSSSRSLEELTQAIQGQED
jgi:hypothetical protein